MGPQVFPPPLVGKGEGGVKVTHACPLTLTLSPEGKRGQSGHIFHDLGVTRGLMRVRQELRFMLAAFSVSMVLLLFAASGVYLLEREVQADTFGDLPSALWWMVVTLSTVGYGEAIPATPLRRALVRSS